MINLKCPNCEKEFKVKKFRFENSKIICCSMSCRTQLYKNFPLNNPFFKNRNFEEKFFDEKMTRLKTNAKQRKVSIDKNIKGKDLYELWLKQDKKCFYTKIPMGFNFYKDKLITISVDRKDSTVGYFLENLVLCCYGLNSFKFNYTQEETFKFLDLIKENYENTDKKN